MVHGRGGESVTPVRLSILNLFLILRKRAATTAEPSNTITAHAPRYLIALPHPCMLDRGKDEITAAKHRKGGTRDVQRLVAQHIGGVFSG